MEKEIKLPRISEGEDTGLVSDVYVKEGDHLEAEQSIIAVESDKATVDVPIEEEGDVVSLKVKEGDEINVGDLILILETGNGKKEKRNEENETGNKEESVEAKKEEKSEKEPEQKEEEEKNTEAKKKTEDEKDQPVSKGSKKQEVDEDEMGESKESESKEEGDNVPAAPLARKFARELGIDLDELVTGDPQQRITRKDIFEHAKNLIRQKNGHSGSVVKKQSIELPDFSQWGKTEREPLSKIRRITAEKTGLSWQNIPHVTHFDEADITSLEQFRKRKNEDAEVKLTVTAMLLKILGESLKKYPKFNASLDMEKLEVVYKEYIHIGVAVDTEDGLLLPVVRDVDQKSVEEISEELNEVAKKARNRKLSPDDMKGGNFVLSNLGGIGGTSFTPIIFPPQVAILGVSKAYKKPVYHGTKLRPRKVVPLSLSYDHRLIDGADAARFMSWVCDALKNPWNIMM